MAINYDELGKRISYFRARKGFSQETLGERIGVNNKHISNIEIGKSRPSLESLVEIANALGISADDLLVEPGTFCFHRGFRPAPDAPGMQ